MMRSPLLGASFFVIKKKINIIQKMQGALINNIRREVV